MPRLFRCAPPQRSSVSSGCRMAFCGRGGMVPARRRSTVSVLALFFMTPMLFAVGCRAVPVTAARRGARRWAADMGHGQTRIRAKERRAGEQRAQRDRVEHERKRTAEQQRAEEQKQPGGDVARAQARPRVVL